MKPWQRRNRAYICESCDGLLIVEPGTLGHKAFHELQNAIGPVYEAAEDRGGLAGCACRTQPCATRARNGGLRAARWVGA
jgi:hypothetical protein